jgi:hypothetical protein
MRKPSLSLAALALVLAGPLASVAQAANLERDHREQRSDLYAGQTTSWQYSAQASAPAVYADNLERQNREERSDLAAAQTSAAVQLADNNNNAKADRG